MRPDLSPLARLRAACAAVGLALAAGCADGPGQPPPPGGAPAPLGGGPPPALAQPPAPETPPPAVPAEQMTAFRDYLERERAAAGIPGLAVVVVQPARVLLLEAAGVRVLTPVVPADATPPAVTTDTRFSLGPASQAINSLLIARLAEARLVGPDAPARRCWDEFKLADAPATRNVTLRDLLSMTAGVPSSTDALLRAPNDTPADLFAALAQIRIGAQPGREFHYSRASAAAAGYLATLAAFRDAEKQRLTFAQLPGAYAALAANQIFTPLGMARATFRPPDAAEENEAIGHVPGEQLRWVHAGALTPVGGGALLPADGLRASARDVAVWLQMELRGGALPDGQTFLPAALVRERWQPQTFEPGRQYGLGWRRQFDRGLEAVLQSGAHEGQSALVAIIPRYKTGVAVLVNAAGPAADSLLRDALLNLGDLLRETAGETGPLARPVP